MPTKKEKKFDQQQQQNHSKKPSFTTWSKSPMYVTHVTANTEICFDGLCLEGEDGGGSDDDDNLAYRKIVESVKDSDDDQTTGPSVSVFKFSQSFPGGVEASLKVLKLNDGLFVSLLGPSSFNKECFVSLLDYAEEVLHCQYVHVLLHKQDNHAHKPLLQSFRFMGFEIMPVSAPIVSSVSSLGYLVLRYQVESSDSSDEDD